MRFIFGLTMAAALAACSRPAEPERAAPAPPAPAPVAAPAAPAPTSAKALLNLTGEGLALVDPDSGASRPLPFGVDKAVAMRAVGAARGAAEEEGTNTECGAGSLAFARFAGGPTLWFQEGKFAGWDAGRDGDSLSTAAGLKLGSTRAELESAYDASVEETSLGTEFEAGGLSGVLDSTSQAAKVTALWAGVTCVFR